MKFEHKIAKTIEKYSMLSPHDTVVIGLSGGADSVALFKVLCSLREKYRLTLHAAHVNHMIRGDEALRDAKFAEALAKEHGVQFHLLDCNVPELAKQRGISTEAAGREVRYDFFKSIAGKGKIAVAHHKGDSAETTVINLIRGSGLKGLKGIAPVNGNIIRPLIECSRAEIEEYLAENGAAFMTDSTNNEDIYTRNLVRHKIIPAMAQLNPNIISTIYDNSRIIGDDEDFISSQCAQYEQSCIISGKGCVSADFSAFPQLHISLRRRLIISAFRALTGTSRGISSANVESVLSLPTGGATSFCGIHVRRSYDCFVFSHTESTTLPFRCKITPPEVVCVRETGRTYNFEILPSESVASYEKDFIYLDADSLGALTIRSREEGDVFSPLGTDGRKKVKDFLIDKKIPRHERTQLPVLTSDGTIAAILCLRADNAYKVTPETKKILRISEVSDL